MKIRIAGEEYEVDPGKLTFGEAKRIEQTTGLTFSKWGEHLAAGSVTALQGLVFILMRRSRPEIRFDDVDGIEFGEVQIVPDPGDEPAPVKAGRSRPVDPTRKAS